jgi:hypothetical protein
MPVAVRLRVLARVEAVALDEVLREMSARPLAEDRDRRADDHARLEVPLLLAVLVDAPVARDDARDALDAVRLLEEDLGRREAG